MHVCLQHHSKAAGSSASDRPGVGGVGGDHLYRRSASNRLQFTVSPPSDSLLSEAKKPADRQPRFVVYTCLCLRVYPSMFRQREGPEPDAEDDVLQQYNNLPQKNTHVEGDGGDFVAVIEMLIFVDSEAPGDMDVYWKKIY